MKRSNLILLCVLGAIFFFMTALQIRMNGYVKEEVGRDYGNYINDIRPLSEFKKITVNDGIKVVFKQGPKTGVSVKGRRNLMSFIKTEIVNGTLIIEKTKRMRKGDSVSVFISNPILDSLSVGSGASFISEGMVSGNTLKLIFKGESEGKLELGYELLECSFSMDSKVVLAGSSKKTIFN